MRPHEVQVIWQAWAVPGLRGGQVDGVGNSSC